jgi:hypothetical protein
MWHWRIMAAFTATEFLIRLVAANGCHSETTAMTLFQGECGNSRIKLSPCDRKAVSEVHFVDGS